MNEIGLYLHIPFCKKKCLYCDFPSYAGCENIFDDYVSSLLSEINNTSKEYRNCKVSTVFIGGGTPTLLPPILLGKILDAVLSKFNVENNAEITVEANPGTLNLHYFNELKKMDVNRLSFGVQSWQDKLLEMLGRIHNNKIFIENFYEARAAGFENINCDLMFSLPNQSLIDWEETLEKVIKLNPEHISVYSLIIEEGTPFKDMYDRGVFEQPDEVLDREMYYLAKEMLRDKGYNQYEISNFSKKGFESRHNIAYWQTKEYLGLGLGSHSYLDGSRFHNTYNMAEYISSKGDIIKLRKEIEFLLDIQKIEEFMFLGLRMTNGISVEEFKRRFQKDIFSVYKDEIKYLLHESLIESENGKIFLTQKGTDVSNYVFEKFILNET